jgi:hypothetical protein
MPMCAMCEEEHDVLVRGICSRCYEDCLVMAEEENQLAREMLAYEKSQEDNLPWGHTIS